MHNEIQEDTGEEQKYILFRLGEELYGTPLLDVREVVEPIEPKPIPNTVRWFRGVINIRGEIVGVVDLRARFGQSTELTAGRALMIFSTAVGPLAGLVDKVDSVARIPESDIERHPNVMSVVGQQYLLGIGKLTDRLVTLIDLARVLGEEDLRQIPRSSGQR